MEPPAMYAATRTAVSELAAGLDATQLTLPVPACPGWTVRDVVVHLTGVAADQVAGRMDGAASPEWTAAQLAARAGLPLADVLAEWTRVGPQLEAMLPELGRAGMPHVVDVITHRHDLHGALGLRPPAYAETATEADVVTFRFALGGFAFVFGRRVAHAELPPVLLDGGDWRFVAGGDEPVVTAAAPAVEIYRALGGRRSEAQIRAWDWSADPAPYLALLSPFGPPATADVAEWDGYAGSS